MLSRTIGFDDVQDVESFARSILNDHIASGARRRNGTLTGPAPLSSSDFDDCLTDLIAASWEAFQRFDGRGRFSGYLAWKLHREITDWKRRRWKSTRYLTAPIVETSYDDELNGATHDDEEIVGLNAKTFHWRARDAYERTCLPLAESGMDWV